MKSNINYWEKVLERLPESYREWFEAEAEFLRKNITGNSHVLEIGCGDGRSIRDLLTITKNVTGIDHDVDAVEHAMQNFSDEKQIRILKADAENLPFDKESFNHVICMTTFANFADKKHAILSEMKRVLKPNGSIIISVFSERALPERMKIYKALDAPIKEITNSGTVIFDQELRANISEQFTKSELENIFKQANLRISNIQTVNIAHLCCLVKE